MKIEIKKAIVEFKSKDKYFDKEEKVKHCTARELTNEQIFEVEHCTHIRIVSENGQRKFERELTDISVVDDVIELANPDRKLVLFSWKPETVTNTRGFLTTKDMGEILSSGPIRRM